MVEHVLDLILHTQENAGEIDIDILAPVCGWHVRDGPVSVVDARVVERAMQPTEVAYRELDHGLRVAFVRDVGANENRCATLLLDLGDDAPSSLNIAICDNDGCAARRD